MENKGLRLDPTLHQSKYLQWPPICPLNWSGPGASVPLPINGGLFLESRGFVWPPGCGECSGRSLKPATSPSCNDKQKMHFLFCGIHWLAGGFSLHQLCMARWFCSRGQIWIEKFRKRWRSEQFYYMKIWQENNTARYYQWRYPSTFWLKSKIPYLVWLPPPSEARGHARESMPSPVWLSESAPLDEFHFFTYISGMPRWKCLKIRWVKF